jgi:hypothetical protein
MKTLERLLFTQGRRCFFCEKPLTTANASVEHLVATAKGGQNGDDNLVACCESINQLLGSMSLKEKIQVVLNQKGEFKCPNGTPKTATQPKPAKPRPAVPVNDKYSQLVKNLKERKGTPSTILKLKNTIRTLFQKQKISPNEVETLVKQLQSKGAISINGSTIKYRF